MPDVFSGLGDLLGGGLKNLAGGVFNELSQWLWSAGLNILKVGVSLADKVGTVNMNVHSGPMAAVWSVTLPIGLAIAGCIFYFSLATPPRARTGWAAPRGVGHRPVRGGPRRISRRLRIAGGGVRCVHHLHPG